MFTKILIANRGEISCRVIATAKRLGITTVAIYSESDRHSLHVQMADEAVCVDPSPPLASYLNQENVLEAALLTGSQAIHPGYGFLSENPEFAKRCENSSIIFIGPSSEVITNMGIKSVAKQYAERAGVQCIPGCEGISESTLLQEAAAIGFPLLLKADRGGGGKGIRYINDESELQEGLQAAKREAQSAFGNSDILLEKRIHPARHIEIQIFRDNHGNCIHLYERDCSLQRRHQKIIEESPATALRDSTKQAMYKAAVTIANEINYRGAGTVEFLVDQQEAFYFMEVNTRLQVEHPVTEMVTGTDLVEWQLLVAAGEPLPRKQEELQLHGHAIEMRLYAENPDKDFIPATGKITHLSYLQEPGSIRIDSGIQQFDVITPYYDPILSKIIVHGDTRKDAIKKSIDALSHYHIAGISTNSTFLFHLIESELFKAGKYSNQALDNALDTLVRQHPSAETILLATLSLHFFSSTQYRNKRNELYSPWSAGDSFRLNHNELVSLEIILNDLRSSLQITHRGNRFTIELDQQAYDVMLLKCDNFHIQTEINGIRFGAEHVFSNATLTMFKNGGTFTCKLDDKTSGSGGSHLDTNFYAPMPGRITSVQVKEGEKINQGTTLMTMEAMKMEHSIKAPTQGKVTRFFYSEGQNVEEGSELLLFENDTELS